MKIKVECSGKEKREMEIEKPNWSKNQIVCLKIEGQKEFFFVQAIEKEKIVLQKIEMREPEKTIPFMCP